MDFKVNQNCKVNVLALFSVLVISFIYFVVTTSYTGLPLSDAENRGIDTPLKLWLNGYLGVFFGFKSNGNIIWLLPVFIIIAWNKVKSNIQVKYFIAFYVLLFLLIAVKGYINGRYQFTLVPISIISMVFLIKEVFDESNQKKLFYLLIALSLFNTLYFTAIDYWPRYKDRFYLLFNSNAKQSSENSKQMDYLTYIKNHIPENENVLVNNLPEYFYYTNRKGLFCWTGQDVVYTPNGEQNFSSKATSEELKKFILEELNCKYFFTTIQLNNYNPQFTAFLEKEADLVFNDGSKYLIYKFKS
ncbi:MAG: hypothetical protein ACK4IK_07000 [Bacteroidia bacterium]